MMTDADTAAALVATTIPAMVATIPMIVAAMPAAVSMDEATVAVVVVVVDASTVVITPETMVVAGTTVMTMATVVVVVVVVALTAMLPVEVVRNATPVVEKNVARNVVVTSVVAGATMTVMPTHPATIRLPHVKVVKHMQVAPTRVVLTRDTALGRWVS
jgi:hypothetical protein